MHRKYQESLTNYESVLDEEMFQQLLAAAYTLQKQTNSPGSRAAAVNRPVTRTRREARPGEEMFQQFLAAACTLQEQTNRPLMKETKWVYTQNTPDVLIEEYTEPIQVAPVRPVEKQTEVVGTEELQVFSWRRQLPAIVPAHSKRTLRTAITSAQPLLILLIIVAFLLSLPWRHQPANSVEQASSQNHPDSR